MPSAHRRSALAITVRALAAVLAAGCSDPDELPDATIPNRVDTVTLGALTGTPVTTPSGFSASRGAIRTDQESGFEFAFNIDAAGTPVFLPLRVLGLVSDDDFKPGLKRTELGFAAIRTAERNDFITDDAVPLAVGDRFFLRSRLLCSSLGVPYYGKLEVLGIDPAARSVTFQVLVNHNCGYIGLEPGIPSE
ncbi:MAG TPA: hypothetical protein VNK43_03305 [Gemmatimonadales bacterium]|nr:hypothetical protein [Gemmatimonadales bacterium]